MAKVKILNEMGHAELELMPQEVIEKVNEDTDNWVFVDGMYVERNELREEMLITAREIIISPRVQAG